jgi:hypothetical protein
MEGLLAAAEQCILLGGQLTDQQAEAFLSQHPLDMIERCLPNSRVCVKPGSSPHAALRTFQDHHQCCTHRAAAGRVDIRPELVPGHPLRYVWP